jgi:hypothetical protein
MNRSFIAFIVAALTCSTAFAQLPNDECIGAFALGDGINPSPPLGMSGTFFTNVGALAAPSAPAWPCGSGGNNSDVWYSYVASATGSLSIDTCTPAGFTAGTETDSVVQVFDGSGGCGAIVSLACDDDSCTAPGLNSLLSAPVTVGITYYIRVADWSTSVNTGTFYLTLAVFPPPTNDECGTATPLSLGTNPTPPASGNFFSMTGASISAGWPLPTCDTSIGGDLWYSYVPSSTGPHRFSSETPAGFTAGSLTNTVIDVFPDTLCVPGAAIACDDDGGLDPTLNGSVVATLTTGLAYYIRVSDDDALSGGTFYVNVSLATPPANDECAGAFALSLGTNPLPPTGSSGTYFTLTDATLSAGWAVPTCDTSIAADVWFSFVPAATGLYQIDSETPAGFTAGTMIANVLDVFPDSGCAPTTALACDDDTGVSPTSNGLVVVPMTAGLVYYVRISDDDAYDGGTFYVNVAFLGPQATNDECSGAVALSVGVNPTPGASGNFFNNMNTTTSVGWPALSLCPTASAAINLDCWFSFTPVSGGVYQFDTSTPCGFTAGTMTNPTMALYDGSVGTCGTPFAHTVCDGDSGNGSHAWLKATLVAGTTYYVRVGPTATTGAANVNATFYLTVTQGDIVNDTCAGALPLTLGTNPSPASSCSVYSNIGATDTAGWPAVCGTIAKDLWFTFTPAVSDSYIIDTNTPCGLTPGSTSLTTIAVYSSITCTPVAATSCDTDTGHGTNAAVNVFLTGGSTYYVRVGVSSTTGEGTFYVNVNPGLLLAANDTCATATPVVTGINPAPAASCFTFDNSYATSDTMGYPAVCGTILNDVWHVFVPTFSATYIIDTETPAGFTPGRMTNSTLAVYPDCLVGAPLACDADSGVTGGGLMSIVEVALTAGVPAYIRVGSTSATTTEGSYYLTITPKFSLGFASAPCGPGVVDIAAIIVAGPPLGGYFMCVTTNAGAYPAGWFFGIDPFLSDVLSQAQTPGFIGVLDALGGATVGPICGLPPAIFTFYGVALAFATPVIDIPIANTDPTSISP